jgi:anti-sigma B factor antagonist
MGSVELDIDVSDSAGWTIVAVSGELDLYTSPTLRDRIHDAAGTDRKLAVDLTDVSFIDSSGLGAIVGALKHVRELDGEFAVIAPADGPLSRLLSLTGLDQIVHPVNDREALG